MTQSVLSVVFLLMCSPVIAQQDCFTHVADLMDTSSHGCLSEPSIDKALGIDVFTYLNEQEYILLNTGNELQLVKATNHNTIQTSFFNVPNQGDSDYDLLNLSLCDGCQLGVANFKTGLVLFSLTGSNPRFGPFTKYIGVDFASRGGFVFKRGMQHYLITQGFTSPASLSYLYEYNSPTDIVLLQEIPHPVANGFDLGGGDYYLGGRDQRLRLYKWVSDGLSYYSELPVIRGFMGRFSPFAVDGDLMSVASIQNGLTLYDISARESPVTLANIPTQYTVTDLSGSLLWAARQGVQGSGKTFWYEDGTLQEIDPYHWSEDQRHNQYQCIRDNEAGFAGGHLYLARHTVAQAHEINDYCSPDLIFADGFESGDTNEWN